MLILWFLKLKPKELIHESTHHFFINQAKEFFFLVAIIDYCRHEGQFKYHVLLFISDVLRV